jgi:hypothetical protein
MRAEGTSTAAERGTGMRIRPGVQAASPRPARSGSPPATLNQQRERHDDDGRTAEECESCLDAYIKELVDAAPPL